MNDGPLNVYEAHAQALCQVQAESVANLSNDDGTAGTVQYANNQPFPAWIGPFVVSQQLREDGGGFSNFYRATVIIQKSDLPAGTAFRTGHWLNAVTAPGSIARKTSIKTIEDKFSFWQLEVEDASQGV